jgi:hypothetical protein
VWDEGGRNGKRPISCVRFEVHTVVGYKAVKSFESQPTFQGNMLTPSSGLKSKPSRQQALPNAKFKKNTIT